VSYPQNVPRITQQNTVLIRHYLLHGNKAAAYRDAYDCAGMTDKTAYRRAQEVFDKPHVQLEIMKHQQALADKFDVQAEDLQKFLLGVARRCMRDKKDKQGNLVPTAPAVSVSAVTELNRMLGYHAGTGAKPTGGEGEEREVIELDESQYRRVRTEMLVEDDI
jgi:phage terminase small subunit